MPGASDLLGISSRLWRPQFRERHWGCASLCSPVIALLSLKRGTSLNPRDSLTGAIRKQRL